MLYEDDFALHVPVLCSLSIFRYISIIQALFTIAVTAVVPNHEPFSTSTLEGARNIDAFVNTVVAVKGALIYVWKTWKYTLERTMQYKSIHQNC